ncbi:integrin alpha-4-like [Ruditapes philippinarum]|uniref:integrin alpha-4-like n=1 Tax=Ruditapes philippinarum TaxID=129788 RepID=UPI00295B0922|nr:integrin alpha-4-like [Ruditapes philippinarum]
MHYIMDYSAALINLINLIRILDSYNIEEQKTGIVKGVTGSHFGYTVAIVQAPGWKTDENNKTFLVGAPNDTYRGIRGHGLLHECTVTLKRNETCKLVDTSGASDVCEKLRRNDKTRTACEQNSRLGSSLAVNKYYIQNGNNSNYATIPMAMVCAPGWKNPFYETYENNLKNYMVGKCIKLTNNLKAINCTVDGSFGCWPFWASPGKGTVSSSSGRPVFSYAEAGFSLAFTKDGYELVGGPGVDDWRGAFSSPGKKWVIRQTLNISDTTYFGYDLKAGRFKMDADIVVGAPNYNGIKTMGHVGQAVIFKGNVPKTTIDFGAYYDCSTEGVPGMTKHAFEKLIRTSQKGTKFGAVVETVDVNGDGFDEVLVAAPLYSGENPDEGRVFVYTFSKSQVCGPIGVLSGGTRHSKIKDKTMFARFGTCIASVGDLANDNLNDVAIGAPYENNGVGAIYIYNGGYSVMKDQYTQRITGQTVDPGIRTFGWSIYGNEDIDNNGFPDMVVGAYESDTVVVFRTKPVITVDVDMTIEPDPIPLNTSFEICPNDTEKLCFDVKIKLSYKTMGHTDGALNYVSGLLTMMADTLYLTMEESTRVVFLDTNSDKLLKNLTLERGKLTNETITLMVKGNPEPKDIWTEVRIESSFEVLKSDGTEFDVLDPVIDKNDVIHATKDVEFEKKCVRIETCTSDLEVTVDKFIIGKDHVKHVDNNTEIYIGEATELVIVVDVRSVNKTSHSVFFTSNVSSVLSRPISPDHGIIGASCELTDHTNTSDVTLAVCKANNILLGPRNIKVKFYYDISNPILFPNNDLERMKDFITIEIKAEQKNPDLNPYNNIFEEVIPVRLKHDIVIQEDNNVDDQIVYEDDVNSPRVLSILQRFYVSNRGPSFLHFTYVNFTVPATKHGVQIAMIKNISNSCSIKEDANDMSIIDTDDGTEGSIEILKKEDTITDINEDDPDENFQDMNSISCQNVNYDCIVIECKLTDMEQYQQEVFEFTVDVFEKGLAKEKNAHGVRFATFANVSDPNIWYGMKSVAWSEPVFARKWATFFLKHGTAPGKVNMWILILSAAGGLVLLTLLIIILWKCNFFERKKRYQILDWKESKRNDTAVGDIVPEQSNEATSLL